MQKETDGKTIDPNLRVASRHALDLPQVCSRSCWRFQVAREGRSCSRKWQKRRSAPKKAPRNYVRLHARKKWPQNYVRLHVGSGLGDVGDVGDVGDRGD